MTRGKIIGVGAYAPKRILTNADLERMVDTNDEWIFQRSGIRERRIVDENETTSDLAVKAAQQALLRASLTPDDIDLIVVGTTSADMQFPSTANFVQQKLGCRRIGSMDVWAACTGSIYSLAIGSQFIETGKYRRVLCIGAESLSRLTDWTDRSTCVLLADGAGAAILEASQDGRGVIDTDLYSDGRHWELLYMAGGGAKFPATHETVDQKLHFVKMRGNELFKVAVRMFVDCAATILKRHGLSASNVDLFVPHQANLRIIEAAAKRLDLPMDRVFLNVDRYGNTGAASIYIALEEAASSGRLRPGDLVLMAAFGGGVTWGAALVRW
jgi:3-oxoacyl-[acyl-carrier-protein] synthase III